MCLTCSIVNAKLLPVGGIIYKDDYIVLHHCIDINIPGYLIISPLRHVYSFSDLNQTEILKMGTIMKLAVTALEQVDGVEKVYIANFGEETTHFHMHIFPRYKWMLHQSAQDICIDTKVDGAKLLSFYRQQYKTTPNLMKENDIVAVTEYIQNIISSQISG